MIFIVPNLKASNHVTLRANLKTRAKIKRPRNIKPVGPVKENIILITRNDIINLIHKSIFIPFLDVLPFSFDEATI
ncbi:hypothetical protein HYW99_02240 [Candidatus Woesearchaeota archaeon]|nr:hypothetical protein [Candidatus Woesearchaeota archaeon]